MKPFRLTALALVVFAVGCSSDPVGPPPRITALPRALTTQEQSLIQADNRLAIKLLKQVNAETRDTMPNLFISPLSVAMALAMAYNGAATTTAEAMRSTLELDGMTVAEVNEGYRSLIELLRNLDPRVHFQIANSVWYRQDYAVKQSFLDVNRDYYDAQVTPLDFLSPSAPATINAWVSQQTHGLYLIDAIYFKGDWTAQFDANLTQPRPFRLEDRSYVNVPTMARGEAQLRTALRPNATVVDLPYGGQAFSMTIVIPDDSSSVDHLVMALTAEQWDDWTGNLRDGKAELQLPKFKLTNDLGLIPTLGSLGMGIAFGCEPLTADFTGIHEPSELCITEVKHKTYVDVNEEGTEAAAVTEVGVGFTCACGPQRINIDRPFLFALRENLSGTILFMGVIRHPSTE